ncbi:nSTAND1 domain-containing NTPase [Catenulispora pinisilvae]|uniref:nSTAND1 domain-containing NTPase n=1 Tax=Catenulispora pinisilvae TaxID=2705253 RepID=UPI00189209CD|nr:PD40 domain-containing protein [Catenulispora pinisilvae]
MSRSEQPLVGDDSLTAFAADLRTLRAKAGSPPYRRLARLAHYSSTTLADAAAGKRLPSLAVTLAYVRACGAQAEQWEARWHELAAELAGERRGADPEPGSQEDDQCPYAGLSVFEARDARWFFGRERLTEELVARVRSRRFTALFGASGSGKSSLLRAGLLPGVNADADGGTDSAGGQGWPVLLFTPGPHPLDECAARLAVLAGSLASGLHRQLREDSRALHLAALQALLDAPADVDLLVVVDQFEEVFTLCAEDEREQFLRLLLTAAVEPNSRTRVVVGVRADFYQRCVQYPDLVEALRDAQVLVGPMSTEELRRAISGPAAAVDCVVEGALLARIVADAAGQPSALPLISHALRETWRRRRGNTLTVAGYEAAGAIHYALSRTAEATYQALAEDQQRVARGILLRLVALGEGTEDTKRPAMRGEFDAGETGGVLDALARARLIALDADTVELTHEALLSAWPRLRRWIDEDRAGLLIHQQLTDAAIAWEREAQDAAHLYRGSRLATATEWAARHHAVPPSERVRQFLAASLRHARRGARVRRTALAALGALALAASLLAVAAFQQRATAQRERDQAIASQLLNEAEQLRGTDPSLAAQMMLASYRVKPTSNAYTDLLGTENIPLSRTLTDHTGPVYGAAFASDGRTLATCGEDGTVRLWNVTDSAHPRPWGPPVDIRDGGVHAVAFSPGGRTLATADGDGAMQLWNVTDPATPRPWGAALHGLSSHATSVSVAFSTDGGTLAGASQDGTLQLWNVTDPARPTPLGQPFVNGAAVSSATLSPDGRTLAVADADSTVRLWNITDPARPVLWAAPIPGPATHSIAGQVNTAYAVAFSPDGGTLATGYYDSTVRLWDVTDPARPAPRGPPLVGQTNIVQSVAFSPDGRVLASGGYDHTVLLWNVTDLAHPVALGQPLLGHSSIVNQVAFSPDGHLLATAADDGTTRLWSLPKTRLVAHSSDVNGVAFSPDGRTLASVSSDGTVRLWNLADPARPVPWGPPLTGHTSSIVRVAFSPDGRTLATAARDDTVRLWNVTDPARATALNPPLTGPTGYMLTVAFSPDGRTLAGSGADYSIRLWDATDPAHPRALAPPLTGHHNYVFWLTFNPRGTVLASGGADDTLRLWNLAAPAHPAAWGNGAVAGTDGILAGVFTHDGSVLITGEVDHSIRFWHVADPQHPTMFGQVLTGHTSYVYWVGLRPDGRTLISTSGDGTIRLWNVTDLAHPTAIGGAVTDHTGPIDNAALSPDGRTLATASDDRTVNLTDLDVTYAIDRVCATTGDALTPAAWARYLPTVAYARPCP